MFENIPYLKALGSLSSTLKAFTDWRAKKVGDIRGLIEELKENSRFCWLVLEENIQIEEVIHKLSTSEFDRLNKAGFDFNSLKKEKIQIGGSLGKTDLSSWKGKDTQALVFNIYDKIKDLKAQYPFTKNSKKIQWKKRVRNIQKRILLLLTHVNN